MNRRQLFAALGAVAVAPDELWTPSRKIFLPPRGGWVSTECLYGRVAVTSELTNYAGSPLLSVEELLVEFQRTWDTLNKKVPVIRTAWGQYAILPSVWRDA